MTLRQIGVAVGLGLSGAIGSAVALGAVTMPTTGASLALGNSYTNGVPTTVAAADVTVNDISANAAGSYTYANGWSSAQTPITVDGMAGSPYGFYDDFVFKIMGSAADSITSTINLQSNGTNTNLSNLDAQLFLLGSQALPAFSPGGMINDTEGVTHFTINNNVSGSTVVLDPTQTLSAGTYVLQIRGLVTGGSGGSYSGVLDVTPVPLPGSLWLMVGGLGLLPVLRRRGLVSCRVAV